MTKQTVKPELVSVKFKKNRRNRYDDPVKFSDTAIVTVKVTEVEFKVEFSYYQGCHDNNPIHMSVIHEDSSKVETMTAMGIDLDYSEIRERFSELIELKKVRDARAIENKRGAEWPKLWAVKIIKTLQEKGASYGITFELTCTEQEYRENGYEPTITVEKDGYTGRIEAKTSSYSYRKIDGEYGLINFGSWDTRNTYYKNLDSLIKRVNTLVNEFDRDKKEQDEAKKRKADLKALLEEKANALSTASGVKVEVSSRYRYGSDQYYLRAKLTNKNSLEIHYWTPSNGEEVYQYGGGDYSFEKIVKLIDFLETI
jgi:hypothetical protein